ncbi:MAG: LPS-assembly protein LptD [Candidatus Methylomirabilales bacterium]
MRLLLACLAALLLVCLGVPAAAQRDLTADLDRLQRLTESVEVDADELEYVAAEGKLIARGNVRVIVEGRALAADEVVLDVDDETLVATGHVVLVDGESRLEGDRLEYGYRTNRGRLTNGQGFFAPGLSLSGREIRREGERQFAVVDGAFTACRLCQPSPQIPDWEFRARQATVYLDEWIVSRGTTLWAKGLPVLYTPLAAVPIGPRRTGFLIPRLNYGTRDGFGIRQPFFWAISRSQDATIAPVYRTKRGWELDAEYRYVIDEQSRGSLVGRYLHDNAADAPRPDRAELRWLHDQVLAPTWTFKADARYLSERRLPRDISDSAVADRTQRAIDSNVFVTQATSRYVLLGLAQVTQDLSEESQETRASRLPEGRLTWLPGRLFGTPLLLEGETSAVYLERNRAEDAGRFDLHPVLHLPLALGPWLSSAASLALRETAYTESERRDGDTTRFLVEVSERLASRVLRRFDAPGFGLTRLTHVIEPSLTYLYVPWQDQRDFPQFDRVDFISPQNRLVARLGNQWLGRSVGPAGEVQSREVASLEVAQSLNLHPETREFSDVYLAGLTPERVDQAVEDVTALGDGFSRARERRFSNLVLQAAVSPWAPVALRAAWAVHPGRPRTEGVNTGIEIRLPERLRLDFAHTYVRDRAAQGFLAKIEVPLGRDLLLDFLTRYDLRETALQEQAVGIRYGTCCWEAALRYTYRSRGPGEGIENDIRLTLDLRVPTPASAR